MKSLRKGGGVIDGSSSLMRTAPSFYLYAKSHPNPILITDSAGTIQYVNGAWERLTGYTSDEAIGKNPRFLGSGKTAPELYAKLWTALRAGETFESEEFVNQKKDGTEFSIRTVFFPIQIGRDVTYLVQELHDISQRKGIERQKDAFISAASHELRTPLSVIMVSLDLLRYELEGAPGTAKELLNTLHEETARLASLLSDLLEASLIQSGRLHVRKEERDLSLTVHRVADELRTTLSTHTIDIEDHGNSNARTVYDEGRIAQVITNLVSNAVKYSPAADRVIVRLDVRDVDVLVSVQDFGIGVRESEQKKIFDMFYRAENEGIIKGTGLGLFISAQIIAAHGGRLWVTSEAGNGSTFHFSLPLPKKE